MTTATISIHVTQGGTYTLYLTREGVPRSRLKAGIPSLDEARTRAKVWVDACGYELDQEVHVA